MTNMKCNSWTVALISAGVLSLPGTSNAEEKPSSVLTALSSTTLSGYVDTSAHWNLGTGNANLPPYTPNGQPGGTKAKQRRNASLHSEFLQQTNATAHGPCIRHYFIMTRRRAPASHYVIGSRGRESSGSMPF